MRGGASLVINDSTCTLKYDFDIGPLIINFDCTELVRRDIQGLIQKYFQTDFKLMVTQLNSDTKYRKLFYYISI